VTVVKNKIAPPFRKVEFDILFNQGISREGELLELGLAEGIVLKSGTWFSLKHPTQGEVRLGQGMEKARAFLVDNPDVAVEIDKGLRGKLVPKSSGSDDERPEPMTTSAERPQLVAERPAAAARTVRT
jgi:recombination protein RecA